MHIDLNEGDRDLPVDLPIEVRVKQGMMLLDEKYGPGWVEAIDLKSLHLGLACNCVLGQLNGGPAPLASDDENPYITGCNALGLNIPADEPCDYGFNVRTTDGRPAPASEWTALTDAWKVAIVARREELAS